MIEQQGKRKGITPATRAAVYLKHGERCYYCGWESESLEVDHIIPWSQGGADDIDNYVPACYLCNHEKGPLTPEQWEAVRRADGKPWPIPNPLHTVASMVGHLPGGVKASAWDGCEDDLYNLVMSAREPGFDPQQAAKRLMELAVQAAARDVSA